MKLHEIVIMGNSTDIYPNGLTSKDFNISILPFFQMIRMGLGRGKDFFDIKKLNIEVYSNPDSTSELDKYPDGKGYIGIIKQGGFNFENYFNKDSVNRIILIAETTKTVINRINQHSNESNLMHGIIDKIIETVPDKKDQINLYLNELEMMLKK